MFWCVSIALLLLLPGGGLSLETLTDTTFPDYISESGRFVIMFYSPSCGACQSALPVYKKVAEAFDLRDDVDMRTAMVDVTDHPAAGDRYDVWNYPTIIADGDDFAFPSTFDGDATSEQELGLWLGFMGNPNYKPPKSNLWLLTGHSMAMCTRMPVCLVQFTDSRCIQCNARKSQIHEAANNVDKASYTAGVRIAQVDLSMSPEVATTHNISLKGFVEHKVFSYGKMYNFYATDDWKGIVEYAVSWLRPAATDIRNMTTLKEDFYMNEKSTAIALFMPETNPDVMDAFKIFAKSVRDTVKTFFITDLPLLAEMGVEKPKIVIKHYFETLTSAEPPYIEVPVPSDASDSWFMSQFRANEFSLVNHVDGWRRIKQVDDLVHHVGVYLEDPTWGFDELKQLKEELAPIAARFADRIHLFVGDKAEVSTKFEEVDTINVKVPFLFLISDNLDRKFTPDLLELSPWAGKSRTEYLAYFASYVERYLDPKTPLPPKIKTDEDPGDGHEGVIDVVGVSSDRVFSELSKDVLLLVTSSNQCRSCKHWESVFLEFGERFANGTTLTVGMVNSATNELPRPLVMAADPPYIVLARAGRTAPYAGITYFFDEAEVEAMIAFLKSEGGNPLFENGDRMLGMDEEDEEGMELLGGSEGKIVDYEAIGGEEEENVEIYPEAETETGEKINVNMVKSGEKTTKKEEKKTDHDEL